MRRESKVIRLLSIIHNGIILDLACGIRRVGLVRMFVLISFRRGEKSLAFINEHASERW